MFRSVKLKNIKITVVCVLGVLLLLAACFPVLRSAAPDTVMIGDKPYPLQAEDSSDVEAFLTACGYESPEYLFENDITVPKHWNDVYTSYNELQRQQGFDLTPYKGKPAKEYVYFVDDTLNAVVLLSDGRIVAAHVSECDGSEMRILN